MPRINNMRPTILSTRNNTSRSSRNSRYSFISWPTCTVIGVTVLLFLYMNSLSRQQQPSSQQSEGSSSSNSGTKQQSKVAQVAVGDTKEIQTGITATGIKYYHCQGNENDEIISSQQKQLVLLHGSKFTKEDWMTSGILQQFCSIPGWTVSALDFSVVQATTHFDFVRLLEHSSLFANDLPVTAVVTPSASGKVVTDWIMNGNITTLPQYMHTWIPVAVGSVISTTEEQLRALKNTGVDILAIYGDQDKVAGHDTSMRLQQWSGATTVELKGRHPCYLDSPDEFVKVIQTHLAGLS